MKKEFSTGRSIPGLVECEDEEVVLEEGESPELGNRFRRPS